MKRLKFILSLMLLFSCFIVLPAPGFAASGYDDLISSAEKEGTVRVIFELNLKGFKAEGRLKNPDAVKRQRAEIARLQDTVLGAKIAGKIKNTVQ